MFFNNINKIYKSEVKWAIPFNMCTPPIEGSGFPMGVEGDFTCNFPKGWLLQLFTIFRHPKGLKGHPKGKRRVEKGVVQYPIGVQYLTGLISYGSRYCRMASVFHKDFITQYSVHVIVHYYYNCSQCILNCIKHGASA